MRLMTISLLLVLVALPTAGSVYQIIQHNWASGCCAAEGGHCSAMMTECQAATECSLQCLCAASEKPGSAGLLTNRPPLPNAQASLVAALPFAAWLGAPQSNASLCI